MAMDTAALNVFAQVADTRSFVAAGRILGLSASGVGKAITRLEESLDARLFHRSTRSVTLTTEGALFLDRVRRILAEVEAATAELSQTAASPSGRLRIGLPLIGAPFLETIASFKARYPDIVLDLEFDNRFVDVIEEGYDAVVRSGDIKDSRLRARYLGKFRMLLVAAPEYLARRGEPQNPSDLAQHDCLQFRMPNTGKLQAWRLRLDEGDPELHLPTGITCNTNEARLLFALRGLGIAYMSDFTVQPALANGTLQRVLDKYTQEENTFQLLWPAAKQTTAKLRAFIDFVSENVPLNKGRG